MRYWLVIVLLAAASLQGSPSLAEDAANADSSERVLLLLPQGPLLVELQLTIDERPYRQGSQRLLDDLLRSADADKDGKTTWEEVTKSRAFPAAGIDIKAFDTNNNGLVDEEEARRAFSSLTGGGAFAVQGQAFLGGRLDGSQLQQLLDSDGNGAFSDDEIAAATERIRSRDADDNEIVTVQEVAGFNQPNDQTGARAMAAIETILALEKETDWKQLHATLVGRYGKEEMLSPAVFKHARTVGTDLDRNDDDVIGSEELAGLATIEAPLVLDVALGTRSKLRETVLVARMADELKSIARIDRAADGKLLIDLITLRIEVLAPNPKPTPRTFAGQATAYVSNYDKNKNGYIERNELAGAMVAAQFDAWDADGNGQVYADEIRTALERADLPNWQKISVAALSQGYSLFAQLDQNADGRLGVREIRDSAERLNTITLEQDETIRLAVARGNETYKYLSKGTTFNPRRRSVAPAVGNGPRWFQHMDANGDGDVSAREFLGTQEQFTALDANSDGIVEASEAE